MVATGSTTQMQGSAATPRSSCLKPTCVGHSAMLPSFTQASRMQQCKEMIHYYKDVLIGLAGIALAYLIGFVVTVYLLA